jgi:ribosomal protein L11 methyltransferase
VRLRSDLERQLPLPAMSDWREETIEEQVWERCWLEHFQPQCYGQRLWVLPSGFAEPEQSNAVCLRLDPGLAFGTGTHPTTALCLEWLDGLELSECSVIDYGCGSGILAIAALLLGARRAQCVDLDPQALLATRDNAEKNAVADRLEAGHPKQISLQSADVLLANILAGPLVELAPRLTELVRPGGRLVLSGLLREQIADVSTAYQENFHLDEPVCREEWARISAKRKAKPS